MTTAAINVSSRALVEAERELCRRSFYAFVKLAWPIVEPGTPFQDNWHIASICAALEDIAHGRNRKLIITVPPGCGKSLLVCVMFDAWVWTFRPGWKFLYTSFDASLTRRDGGKTIQIIESEWYKERWGALFTIPEDAAHSDFHNDQGGMRFASSVGGKTTGHHPHCVVVDDSIKPKGVNEKSLKDVIDWWKNTMISRAADPATVARVVIQQRLADNDLPGYLLREEPGQWVHVNIPLLYAGAKKAYDPRTELDSCFWPARFPPEVVAELRNTLGSRVFAAQYQQSPVPDSGLIFKKEWFVHRWKSLPPRFDVICQSWDMSFKGGDGSDYVVGQVWGRLGSTFYLIDQVRGRWTFVETVREVKSLSLRHPKARKKYIEDKANGPAAKSQLELDGVTGIVMVNPKDSKIMRAHASTPAWEAGNVQIPADAPWVEEFITEHTSFPTAAHDDQVDTSSQAINILDTGKSTLAAAMEGAAKMGLLS